MTPAIEPVLATVSAQKNAYNELLQLARNKRETIVRGDVSQLNEIMAAESALLHQLGILEQSRVQATQTLAGQIGVKQEDLDWNSLSATAPEKRRVIEQLRMDFAGILSELQQVNEVNSRLLTMHLDYVHELMNTATQAVEKPSYNAAGETSTHRQQAVKLFDKVW